MSQMGQNRPEGPEIRLPLSPQKRTLLARRIQLEARLGPLPATVWIELVNRVCHAKISSSNQTLRHAHAGDDWILRFRGV
jgi:hypothetical protein